MYIGYISSLSLNGFVCYQRLSTIFIFNKCTFPCCRFTLLFINLTPDVLKHLSSTLHVSYKIFYCWSYYWTAVNNAIIVEDLLQI